MTAPASHRAAPDADQDFMARGVAWIRRLLTEHGGTQEPPTAGVFGRSWQPSTPGPPATPPREDAGDPLAYSGPAPALVTLGERFGLDRFERDVVLLCAAVELDPSIRDQCARIHGNPAMRFPSFAIAMMTLPDPAWAALSPDSPLRAQRLVEVDRSALESLVIAPLRVDERLVNHLRGLDHLDVRLRVSVQLEDQVALDSLPPSQRAAADRVVTAWAGQPDDARYAQRSDAPHPTLVADPPVVELVGPDERSSTMLAAAVATAFGLQCYRMSPRSLPADEVELDGLARLWRREAGLSPVAILLETADDDPTAAAFARRSGCATLLQLRQSPQASVPASLRVDVAPPTTAERQAAWQDHLPADSEIDPGQLAAQFAVDTATIARIATEADDPWERCRLEARPRLEGVAERVIPEASWPDLVLDEKQLEMLQSIADQVRHRWEVYHQWRLADRASRGLGIAALFTGPSGTGKTLAAEVLAHDLDLDLYKADLSGIVSKYIGETEKNLRRLFDAAESGGGVLFIDEADALLGKRTEVRDSHDRFANIQIDYLLQRMETYQGVAILATNMRSALDFAFLRRLRFIVEFPFPGAHQRAAIWRTCLPDAIPGVKALDLDALAALPLNGGMIRNVAVNAAFLAAADRIDLNHDHLLQAVRDEFTKLQVPISERQLAGEPVTP
jgi:hypothetical protein